MSFSLQIVAEIISGIGLFIAVVALVFQVRGVKNQLRLGVFTEYTKRYADSRRGMRPEWRRTANRSLPADNLSAEDRESLLAAMRSYFNLCSEEYFLHTRGWI